MKRILAIVAGITEEDAYSTTGLIVAFLAGCVTAIIFCYFFTR